MLAHGPTCTKPTGSMLFGLQQLKDQTHKNWSAVVIRLHIWSAVVVSLYGVSITWSVVIIRGSCKVLHHIVSSSHGHCTQSDVRAQKGEGAFCGMQNVECGKLSRGNLQKILCGFFLWNEG